MQTKTLESRHPKLISDPPEVVVYEGGRVVVSSERHGPLARILFRDWKAL